MTKPKKIENEMNNDQEEFENLVIENTEPRGIDLPPFENQAGVSLIPGENSVDRRYWEGIQKNAAVKMYKRCGFIVNKGPGIARPLNETLDSLGTDDARKAIAQTKDKEQLNTWLKNTSSPYIKKYIASKMEALK